MRVVVLRLIAPDSVAAATSGGSCTDFELLYFDTADDQPPFSIPLRYPPRHRLSAPRITWPPKAHRWFN